MSSHLGHKLPWHLLVDCVTPNKDPGISLPVGTCNLIHITNRKVELQVKNHKYIDENDICTEPSCITKPEEKIFYKSTKKLKPFSKDPRGNVFDADKEEKLKKFMNYFEQAVLEFARTELDTPAKDIKYDDHIDDSELVDCEDCDRFTTLLEFGDKKELFKYSDQEIGRVFSCLHGGQAVGRNLHYLAHDHILPFYLAMNIILHANLKQDDWPAGMKPGSYFRNNLLYPCDGQTFLPHSRKYLAEAMIDLEKTKILNKNLFRFIYFYVAMRLKINRNYSFLEEFSPRPWIFTRLARYDY